MSDKANPPHYSKLKVQPVDAIEAWGLGFCLGNCVKYIVRAGKKEGESELDDLRKALWYLQHRIKQLEVPRGCPEDAADGAS